MRIALVLSQPPGYSETFLRSKIVGLQKNGMEVVLYCFSEGENFDLCPVVVMPKISKNPLVQFIYFLKTAFSLLAYLSVIRRYIALEHKEGIRGVKLWKKIYLNSHLLKAKPDWLHFGFATLALGRETVGRAIGAKMAVSFRGFDIAVYPVKNPGCYQLLWKYVDKVHTNSDNLRELAIKQGLREITRYTKITPAIDVEIFRSSGKKFSQKDRTLFITTGRLHYIKGYISTLEALAILKTKGFNFIYNIVGDGEEYERIAFAAYQLGLKDNVRLLGKLSRTRVKEELEKADIYLQYSVHEGFCNSVLEAQAMGKLCLVSNGGGLSENVLHKYSGWVVPKYSPELLAAQIKKVLELSPSEKRIFAQNAMNRVQEEFTIAQQEQKFVEFYGGRTTKNTEKTQRAI